MGIGGIAAGPVTFGLGIALGLASVAFGGWGLWRVGQQLVELRRDRATAEAVRDRLAALRAAAERIEAAKQLKRL